MNEATSWLFIIIIVVIGAIALAQSSGINLMPSTEEAPQEATTTPQ